MVNRRRAHRILVKRFQLRLAVASMLYVYAGAVAFAGMVFGPLIFKLLSTTTPDAERLEIANEFLSLHSTTWAGLALLLVVTGVSFVLSSHKVAGPLVRFQNVFWALRRGDVADRVRLRDGDWLHDEAADLDAAVRHLRRRIVVLRGRAHQAEAALMAVKAAAASKHSADLERALRNLEEAQAEISAQIGRFTTERAPRRPVPMIEREVWRDSKAGFTLIEVLVVCALTGTLAAIAAPLYGEALNAARVTKAIGDIRGMSREIMAYSIRTGVPPATLADVGMDEIRDPWRRPYEYLVITGKKGLGGVRKDHKLNPINSDFDLYSKGRDGVSKTQISNKDSLDDIIRANDGGFVGLARDF